MSHKEQLQPCPCGTGSDNCTYFYNDDGSVAYNCFREDCVKPKGLINKPTEEGCNSITTEHKIGQVPEKKYRGLTPQTLNKFDIRVSDGDLLIPVYSQEDVKYIKKRHKAGKTDEKNKPIKFSWSGHSPGGENLKLFGQNVFGEGCAPRITIVSGMLDAPSAYQLSGNFPAVSVDSDQRAYQQCQDNYQYLDSFNEIIFAFDNDAPAQKAAKACAELFPRKAKIMKLSKKDANEYIESNSIPLWKQDFFHAKAIEIKGIIEGSSLIDPLKNRPVPESYEFPWPKLNQMTNGYRLGEMIAVGAGTGQGKTLFQTHIADHILKTTDFNIGVLFLEDPTLDAALRFASVRANIPFHLDEYEYSNSDFDTACVETLGSNRLFFYNNESFGQDKSIFSKIMLLIKAFNCKVILLDHISFIVGIDAAEGDERRKLDQMATKLKGITVNEEVVLFVNAHFKRLPGTPHEEGAESSLADFRSSGAIAQLANTAIGLERNQQAEDPEERKLTTPRVMKCRHTGRTGPAGILKYNEYPYIWPEFTVERETDDT